MTGAVYSIASARARIVTPSTPSVAKNSSAASRIFSRTSVRSRCFRSLTPIVGQFGNNVTVLNVVSIVKCRNASGAKRGVLREEARTPDELRLAQDDSDKRLDAD